ncbi:serine/threonine-protein kinase [Nocardia concava]|uniref:serine/threonine-protein kinase n=1 Tax=Nocardia concava TaxID=257281 RepID=UPI00030FCB5E|nr:serine/threonine-protein kinase [Nocardia concava]
MSVANLTDADLARVRAALPGYEIGGQIGRGGCGVVLAGIHRGLNRRVAIKQIPSQFADDMQVRRRFVDEARVMAALDHPHVVPVYDYVEHDDMCLLVLEYLPGGTVENRFISAGFEATAALAVALSCAAGLDAAHRGGVLHRDVKPSNLMFAANGQLKLTDFGIAKIVGGEDTLVTRAGEIIGTPSYIAPEQVRGQQLSPATDVYALATMLYQLLSGVLPFPPGPDALALLFAHAYGEPVPLTEVAPFVPQPIADAVMRGLAPDPSDRFETAETFGVALAEPAAHFWGTNWLTPVGIPVIGADTIVAAATGSSRGPRGIGPFGPQTPPPMGSRQDPYTPPPMRGPRNPNSTTADSLPRTPQPMNHTGPQAGRPGPPPGREPQPQRAPAGFGPRPGPPGRPVAGPTVPMERMRPKEPIQRGGARLAEVERADLVPVQRVVTLPSPRVPFLAAGILAAVTVAAALLGVGTADRNVPPAGMIRIGGVDPAAQTVDLDLSKPIPITVSGTDADSAKLSVDVLGVRAGGQSAALQGGAGELSPPVNRYVLGGALTADLSLSRNGSETAHYRFAAKAEQPATTTATAVGMLLLLLFAGAYAESNARSLRRGSARFASTVGLAVSMGLLGVALIGASWVLLGREPTLLGVIVCAAGGVAAGLVLATGCRRVGKRYRYVRIQRLRERA